MAKSEEIAPWLLTEASAREPYPRKNLYFVGDNQEEVYDYCIWRANIEGYETLDGGPARSSSEMINDILKRAYLRDMLDQEKADAFNAWRAKQYEESGLSADIARPSLPARYLGKEPRSNSNSQESRFKAFIRTRDSVNRATRFEVWKRQGGRCAMCGAMRSLRLEPGTVLDRSRGTSHGFFTERSDTPKDARGVDEFVALCTQCYRKKHSS